MRRRVGSRAVKFEHVLVVGAGQMGGGIAQVVAASGRRVSLHDPFPGAVERGLGDDAAKSLERLAEKGGADPDETLARVTPADELVAADLMIEAITEDAAAKEDLFRRADERAAAERDPRVEHELDPDHVARRGHEAPRAGDRHALLQPGAGAEARRGDPRGADLRRDRRGDRRSSRATSARSRPRRATSPGFVSNRILMPFINEAAYALMEGVAEPEAIDTIAKLGFAHPMGPLALADLIGLDTCVAIMEVLHRGLGNPKYAPCPLLRQYVQAGRLGRKSGRGFYDYSS